MSFTKIYIKGMFSRNFFLTCDKRKGALSTSAWRFRPGLPPAALGFPSPKAGPGAGPQCRPLGGRVGDTCSKGSLHHTGCKGRLGGGGEACPTLGAPQVPKPRSTSTRAPETGCATAQHSAGGWTPLSRIFFSQRGRELGPLPNDAC